MKLLGNVAVFLLSAVGMYMGLSRRYLHHQTNSTSGIACSATDDSTWDEKNRRRVDSVFFMEVPQWMGGSRAKATQSAGASSQAVSSEVQSNPFYE